jgi:DNA repair protein RadC
MEKMMPREKLVKYGASRLNDAELLRLLIGSGNKQVSAEKSLAPTNVCLRKRV